ncbi:transposase [bacterium]|nr:transposase [bacterium]
MYHVIARGIERRKIFHDNKDRKLFLQRLIALLGECEVVCYAWAMLDNHIHLLGMPRNGHLSTFMHRLLTGYAVNFNVRHKRCGHLFQNRYKSILCQKETYFLELIRYIHLNPIRAGMVKDLTELSKYPWCGHSTLVGKIRRSWQETKEVYLRFSAKKSYAIKKYLEFVNAAKDNGRDDMLRGGGLRRSAGGWDVVRGMMKNKEMWQSDERILGDGEYVGGILKKANKSVEGKIKVNWTVKDLFSYIHKKSGIKGNELLERKRGNRESMARAVFACMAKDKAGMKTSEISGYLGVSESAICKMIQRGRRYSRKWTIVGRE